MIETQNKVTEVKLVPISEIKPNPANRNKHPEDQIVRLMKLIHEHGIRHPLVVSNRSGLLVVGHGRLEAFRRLGLTTAPVIYQDFKSDEEEFQFAIADNAVAEWSTLDFVSINEDIKNLGPFDIELLGFKDFRVDPMEKPNIEDFMGDQSKAMKYVTCPHCDQEFEYSQAMVRKDG